MLTVSCSYHEFQLIITNSSAMLSVEAAEWADRRNAAESDADEAAYVSAHKQFKRLARRDKRIFVLNKVGQGTWPEIYPQLRSFRLGSAAVRDSDGILQPSSKRAEIRWISPR